MVMKKTAILFFLVMICSCLLFSCGKGKSDTLYLVKQTRTDQNGTMTVTFYYNSDYKIAKQAVDTGKDDSTVSEYGYDENGYQNYQKVTASSGMLQEIFMKNDSDGRMLELKTVTTYNGKVTESKATYEYIDENGSYIQTSPQGAVNTFMMDEQGNLLSTKTSSLGETSVTYDNKYEGELLKEAIITTVTKTKTTIQTIKYEYDSHGNKVKSTIYDEDGNVKVTETFEYSNEVEFVK